MEVILIKGIKFRLFINNDGICDGDKIMVYQLIDEVQFKMKEEFDFSFLKKYGKIFKVFDDQDSGNICFGVEHHGERRFIKFAGAPTAEYEGCPVDAIERLKSTVGIYESIKQKSLITYITAEEIGNGFAMVFEWKDGECMGRMYEESHQNIMNLPLKDKLHIFSDVIEFLKSIANEGYVAIDFYDGSIMYDKVQKNTTICDIDFFRKSPSINDMGQMWGSSRFMSPEEYEIGAVIDEITNVFTLGKMGFSLFTDSNQDIEKWPLSQLKYNVLVKAINTERNKRYTSIREFADEWNEEVK